MSVLTHVETYSSFAYAVEPRAFYYDEMRHRVEEIQRVWKSPGQIHFYVRDEQARFFELSYEQARDEWSIRAFGENCRVREANADERG